ncbi:hypothetical protein IAR50_002566 [Cryptococcus sp. DSM 104548]
MLATSSSNLTLGLRDLQKQYEIAEFLQHSLLDENRELKRNIDALEREVESAKDERATEKAMVENGGRKKAWESKYQSLRSGLEALIATEEELDGREKDQKRIVDRIPTTKKNSKAPAVAEAGAHSADDDDEGSPSGPCKFPSAPAYKELTLTQLQGTGAKMRALRKDLTAKVLQSFRTASAEAHALRHLPPPRPAHSSKFNVKGMNQALVRFVIEPNTPGVDRNMFGTGRRMLGRIAEIQVVLEAVESKKVRFEPLQAGESEESGQEEE